jgi:RNA polymerase sigma-70 factor (ECF subfamily)
MTPHVPPWFADAMIAELPALRRYARALCGNAALADDLVQDGIERALGRAASLEQPDRIGAWLRRIVHNLYVDDMRRLRARGVMMDLEDMDGHPALSLDPHDAGGAADVARAMESLSLDHKQILILAGVEELTYREIADELNVPLGTVMSRLARARAALRAVLEPAPQPAGQAGAVP